MRMILMLLVAGLLLAAASCGGKDGVSDESTRQSSDAAAAKDAGDTPVKKRADRETEKDVKDVPRAKRDGTTIRLAESQFGTMLFNSRKQAIYIFERDSKDRSACYGECARAWPPVYTDGEPVAGKGVRSSLLGTIKRRGGKRQVTYAGKPLYYYVNEGPGEVRCHNVNLNGGLWWVVGPSGKRRA